MLPTATEIEYFLEAYQTRHVTRASIRLGVSQPTLTQSLAKLEAKAGARLFHRTPQGLVPTTAGAAFFGKARAMKEQWESLRGGILALESETRGRFRVGCHPSVGAYAVPPLLKRLNASPGIELDLIHDASRKITEGVLAYQIDLGFVVNPVRHPDLVLRKLGDDQVTFWRKAGASAPPKRVFTDASLQQFDSVLRRAPASALEGWHIVQTASLELIRTLVASGQGIGILPERVALADGARLERHDRRLPTFKDEIFAAYRKDVLANRAGRELVAAATVALERSGG